MAKKKNTTYNDLSSLEENNQNISENVSKTNTSEEEPEKETEFSEHYRKCDLGFRIRNDEDLLLISFNRDISQTSLYVKNDNGDVVEVANVYDFIESDKCKKNKLVLIKKSDFYLPQNKILNNSMSHMQYLCLKKGSNLLDFLKIKKIDFNKKTIMCNVLQISAGSSSTSFTIDDKEYLTENFIENGTKKIFTLDDKNLNKNSHLKNYTTILSDSICWVTDEIIK